MKRARLCVVAATAAALASVTAPAQAGPGDPIGCLPDRPGGSVHDVVTVNGFDVTVAPGEIPTDIDSAGIFVGEVFWPAHDYAWCLVGDTIDPVFCTLGSLDPASYVHQDPDSGAVTIKGNELVADLTAACPPL